MAGLTKNPQKIEISMQTKNLLDLFFPLEVKWKEKKHISMSDLMIQFFYINRYFSTKKKTMTQSMWVQYRRWRRWCFISSRHFCHGKLFSTRLLLIELWLNFFIRLSPVFTVNFNFWWQFVHWRFKVDEIRISQTLQFTFEWATISLKKSSVPLKG